MKKTSSRDRCVGQTGIGQRGGVTKKKKSADGPTEGRRLPGLRGGLVRCSSREGAAKITQIRIAEIVNPKGKGWILGPKVTSERTVI